MWYRVSTRQLKQLGGSGLQRYWPTVLVLVDPTFSWDWSRFKLLRKQAQQRQLKLVVQLIFPGSDIIEEATIQTGNTNLTVDIYVPNYGLAIEYQGSEQPD
jgi:hypothetical protein